VTSSDPQPTEVVEPVIEDFPEPEPHTRVSPLARLRSTAHAEKLTTVERLRDGQAVLRDRLNSWVITIVITLIAFFVRLVNLGYPNKLVFDETYYAKDAWTLWKFGYERAWPDKVNDQITSGKVDLYKDTAAFIVHPPVGKWLIGFGEQLFGMNSFGWRFMPLVFGSLLVLMTIRMARRLSRSTLIGAIAGVLLTFDGLSFAMSRIALLDVFQAFFLVAAVACVVVDRDAYRSWLADRLEALGVPDLGGRFGPVLWWRPWRLLAGVMFGLAIGTKWNSMYVLATMGVLSVIWDVGARRLAGADFKAWLALVIDGIPALIRLVVAAVVVYVVTWAGWLSTSGGWDRDWGANHPDDPLTKALGPMWASFLQYQKDIYNFHTGTYINTLPLHTYAANPWGWLFMVRPIGIDAVNGIVPGTDGCPTTADGCLRVISGMGTPVLWWMAVVALIVGLVWWIGGRDWRFGVPIIAAMSTYLPWLAPTGRSLFFFYAITVIPFTVTVLAMVMGLILGPADGPRRFRGAVIIGSLIALVVLDFAYIYPVLTDGLLTRTEYYSRMWLQSWI
jgi:dolichyl-phosphate-mannose--protein O-mannosyl transferase